MIDVWSDAYPNTTNPNGSVASVAATDSEREQLWEAKKQKDKDAARGKRYDAGKLGLHLLPVVALEQVALVLDYGQRKYSTPEYDATDNWRRGLSFRSTVGSLLRHSFAFLRGEDRDPESGLLHMAHVAANALFLIYFSVTNGGTDDRYKEPTPQDVTATNEARHADIYRAVQEANAKTNRA